LKNNEYFINTINQFHLPANGFYSFKNAVCGRAFNKWNQNWKLAKKVFLIIGIIVCVHLSKWMI